MATNQMKINLRRRLLKVHTTRRRRIAADHIRKMVARSMKISPDDVTINPNLSNKLNSLINGHMPKIAVVVEKKGDKTDVTIPNAADPKQEAAQTKPTKKDPATKAEPAAEKSAKAPEPKKNDSAKPKQQQPKQQKSDTVPVQKG
jgi:ribosomal protein L31E